MWKTTWINVLQKPFRLGTKPETQPFHVLFSGIAERYGSAFSDTKNQKHRGCLRAGMLTRYQSHTNQIYWLFGTYDDRRNGELWAGYPDHIWLLETSFSGILSRWRHRSGHPRFTASHYKFDRFLQAYSVTELKQKKLNQIEGWFPRFKCDFNPANLGGDRKIIMLSLMNKLKESLHIDWKG